MRPKVTFFTTGLALAGAEMQVFLLCQKLREAGWDIGVISLLRPLAFERELEQLGVPLVNMGVRYAVGGTRDQFLWPADLPRAIWRLLQALRRWRPDVLHCHQVHANLVGRIAGALTGVPVVISTAHNTYEGPRWREWTYRLTEPFCDVTTNVCQPAVDRYIKVGAASAGKIRMFPNGIDIRRFCPDSDERATVRKSLGLADEFMWLAVGNLREAKDYPTMFGAFRQVFQVHPRARLCIAGTGPLAEPLAKTVCEMGIQKSVQFLGARQDIPQLMSAADGYVLSSAWEGAPLAILEACASRLAVVVTRVGGNANVIQHGHSGMLVEPRDPEALADACLYVMGMPHEERQRMGSSARRTIEMEFCLDAVVEKWQRLYTELWERKRAGAPIRELA
jgi:glycosyltransferase involved in cell wall biosynthesis